MAETNILDSMLPTLLDIYEAQIPNRVATFDPATPEEFEPLRECKASLIAEGSAVNYMGMGGLQLTPQGYIKYKDRGSALRTLPNF